MLLHSFLGFCTFFRGLAVVFGESGEGKDAIASFQPADFAERSSESRSGDDTVECYICNTNRVTVERVCISPRPDFPKHPDNMKAVR